jgi:two-component system NtrC family sensor kinase
VTTTLSPNIYSDDAIISQQLKAWGWKVRPGKPQYKKNDVYLFSNNQKANENLWILRIYNDVQYKEWHLNSMFIKNSLDHILSINSSIEKGSKDNSSNILLKSYIEKSLVKMGEVNFPLGFWLDFSRAENVHELLEKLFDLPVFKSNAYLLLCVLKKGESFATVYDYSRGRKVKKIYLESDKFNAIYDHVRKNKKGYLFNMENLSSFLKVQGYAQGGATTSSDYQVVFLVSKNELIPPAQEEILAIKSLLPELIPWIELTLSKETKKIKAEIYREMAKLLPISLNVSIQNKDVENQEWSGAINDLSKKLEESYPQEIKIKNLNTENNSDDTYLDLNHYQRVKLLGELFNTLKHELSNPLFGLKLSQQLMAPQMKDPQLLQLWNNVELNVNRCEQILNSTLDLFGTHSRHQVFDLKDVISQALLLSKSKTKGLIIENQCGEIPKLLGDPSLILHIIFNLIINASEHLNNKKNLDKKFMGKILIDGKISDDQNFYELTVADNGDGVPDQVKAHLFRKFVTSKPQGTGLGLSLSQKLAQKIPGELIYSGNGLILPGAHFILRIDLSSSR